ncbi:hypothetical protein MICRO116_430005 [Micrococcus sp. 116]|nr:hypothetical protein MICRO116_430005 [Micrococcus sp. 116]
MTFAHAPVTEVVHTVQSDALRSNAGSGVHFVHVLPPQGAIRHLISNVRRTGKNSSTHDLTRGGLPSLTLP